METIKVSVGILNPDGRSVANTVLFTLTPEVLFELNRTGETFCCSGGSRGQKFYYRFVPAPEGLHRFEMSQGRDGQVQDQPGLWFFFAEAVGEP